MLFFNFSLLNRTFCSMGSSVWRHGSTPPWAQIHTCRAETTLRTPTRYSDAKNLSTMTQSMQTIITLATCLCDKVEAPRARTCECTQGCVCLCVSVCCFVRKWSLISTLACGCERLMGKYLPCPALSTELSLHCGGESYAVSRSAISAEIQTFWCSATLA